MEKNLQNEEAQKKFKKLVEEIRICMFITNNPPHEHTRPMATIEVEDSGLLWFFTDIRSIKVEEVEAKHTVHLVYSHPGKESYLDVWGTGSVVTDRQMIKDKWSTMVKAWFPNGVDDPNLALLRVQPDQCHYWEAETGKMVHMLKVAASIVTGTKLAEGAEGTLQI
jgi:general stress protein 26